MTESNLLGEGTHLGGCMVVKKGGDLQFRFQERNFGDHARTEDVLEAAATAAKASGSK